MQRAVVLATTAVQASVLPPFLHIIALGRRIVAFFRKQTVFDQKA
jgi:hypothetical protein